MAANKNTHIHERYICKKYIEIYIKYIYIKGRKKLEQIKCAKSWVSGEESVQLNWLDFRFYLHILFEKPSAGRQGEH